MVAVRMLRPEVEVMESGGCESERRSVAREKDDAVRN